MANFYPGDDGEPVIIPRPPPSQSYNPGPPPRGGYDGSRYSHAGPPAPPPDIFGNYPGPETDAAKQLVQQWLALMGYPTNLDANTLTLNLLQNNLVNNPSAAYAWMYRHQTDQQMRDAAPWAQFGMDAGTFHTRKDALDSIFQQLVASDPNDQLATGGGDALHQLYYDALSGNWSQSQLMQHLQNDAAFADLRTAQPWLAAGEGEQQARQQYLSIYGSAPVDAGALAGWFRFNTGTQQLNRAGREAIMTAAPQSSASEAR